MQKLHMHCVTENSSHGYYAQIKHNDSDSDSRLYECHAHISLYQQLYFG